MGDESSYFFDLSVLLHINGLDVRKAAADNPLLHTGEYFEKLQVFLNNAPQIKKSLENISNKNAADPDFNNMEMAKELFSAIGWYKYLPLLGEITTIGHDTAVKDANQILGDFDKITLGITQAKRDKKPEALTGVLNVEDTTHHYESFETQMLQKTIKLLEHEEATRKTQILAVDDAPIILKTISSVLGDDYKVYGMTNPTMLEKFLQQITPELFILDYNMPEMSGFDLVPIIRNFEKHKDTPIIFLTSMGTSDNVSTAFGLGACDFMVKPFQGKLLREKIAKHLKKKLP
jgi:CheY-like chemotaxis protein